MSVTEYLERARECANLADRMTGEDKKKLMEIADAWLKLADAAATEALKQRKANLLSRPRKTK